MNWNGASSCFAPPHSIGPSFSGEPSGGRSAYDIMPHQQQQPQNSQVANRYGGPNQQLQQQQQQQQHRMQQPVLPHHHSPSPVQVLINNSTKCGSDSRAHEEEEEPLPPPPPLTTWEGVRHFAVTFWASPTNKLFVLGAAGAVLYIIQAREQHRWRMAEMQRRIDANPFLRLVQTVLPAGNSS
mmetsp:Transcript_34630/g.52209  ORF Transcript_34630/g.52209 Transcript_34630/m.52209 type:complete len:183 (-) Transcript_34630:478-1026(-)|eukprot:CAMPEP_0206468208 /NCGR_PEP_ID=MMETSP0324_2-20121206/29480_1 /ASSEMBLY_ACC=CAM_ASM_000836 /TAXON_ID=2866 /ORGANISM="Crypthecodinium cohnii, Strain Seligo" /LENGTH=182 /DNA_ID=CAMNT_0053941597 /DNA_START=90 /DNA_END=638 /DNA_ORIENTATION=+